MPSASPTHARVPMASRRLEQNVSAIATKFARAVAPVSNSKICVAPALVRFASTEMIDGIKSCWRNAFLRYVCVAGGYVVQHHSQACTTHTALATASECSSAQSALDPDAADVITSIRS